MDTLSLPRWPAFGVSETPRDSGNGAPRWRSRDGRNDRHLDKAHPLPRQDMDMLGCYISPADPPHFLSKLLATYQLYRQPPITMRVALFVLAFAAVFVLANPSGDKKKAKKTKTPTPAAAAAEEPAPVDGGDAPAA
ncbi:hypothetical protein PLEOSDRAFT_159798 [Pleurotus ostreatus PC15]|uniref:Uncharacterized protein n=2 Tax=Pleurotus TaxID=5320 RepID=A0A067NQB5_PLEO1|nr:hypothetical protein CCMSSC00406_0007833 [Pleurotus cornucopiae]KDQ26277.1 hypothetical protein PLEOSDRAFT_159798 [Pleurotus ostreatus PC15]